MDGVLGHAVEETKLWMRVLGHAVDERTRPCCGRD